MHHEETAVAELLTSHARAPEKNQDLFVLQKIDGV